MVKLYWDKLGYDFFFYFATVHTFVFNISWEMTPRSLV
jgi:hypothetical protein